MSIAGLEDAGTVKKILFLAANRRRQVGLLLDEEAKELRLGLERAKIRDHFKIITRSAVDADDLRRSLLDVEPHIVHFSGHGTGADGLVLHGSDANAGARSKLASSVALANLFALFAGQIECVLLNACYSEAQAAAIYRHVDCVIGMNQAVGDRAAIKFAVGFSDALGAGRSYEVAYKFGCSAIDFEDIVQSLTPVLMARSLMATQEMATQEMATQENTAADGAIADADREKRGRAGGQNQVTSDGIADKTIDENTDGDADGRNSRKSRGAGAAGVAVLCGAIAD